MRPGKWGAWGTCSSFLSCANTSMSPLTSGVWSLYPLGSFLAKRTWHKCCCAHGDPSLAENRQTPLPVSWLLSFCINSPGNGWQRGRKEKHEDVGEEKAKAPRSCRAVGPPRTATVQEIPGENPAGPQEVKIQRPFSHQALGLWVMM